MNKGILGKKIGMTQIFDADGVMVPVTVVEAGPCVVVQKKTMQNDGYEALKIGFDAKKVRVIASKKVETKSKKDGELVTETKESKKFNIPRPIKGVFDKANVTFRKYVREFRLENVNSFEVGQEIKVDIFNAGEKIDVTGTNKGKGWQGAIKRHHAACGPMSHGSKFHRAAGSMGAATYPGRVFKGKKLSGHMGHIKTTVQNLDIVKVDVERNLLLIKGAVPGPKGGYLIIKNSVKA